MPKERFHILLADQVLRVLDGSGRFPRLDEQARFAFRLGAISPDIFFYDLPFLGLTRFGSRLHALLQDSGLTIARRMLGKNPPPPPHARTWLLGFASHFLADGIWHPILDAITGAPDGLCSKTGLEETDCHLWIESELEGSWMEQIGPRDGYVPLLGRFVTERKLTGGCLAFCREMLLDAGLTGVPDRARMRKCLTAQVLLLLLFSSKAMGKLRPGLLRTPALRYLAALCVGSRPEMGGAAPEEFSEGGLLTGKFMAGSVASLASSLLALSEG